MNNGNTFGHVMGVAIALVFGWNVYLAILHFRPPYTYDHVYTPTPVIKQGTSLRMIYVLTRNRVCRTQLMRFVVDVDDMNNVMLRETYAGGAAHLGVQTIKNELKDAAMLPPGHYVIRTFAFGECNDGVHSVVAPDVPFTVVADTK